MMIMCDFRTLFVDHCTRLVAIRVGCGKIASGIVRWARTLLLVTTCWGRTRETIAGKIGQR